MTSRHLYLWSRLSPEPSCLLPTAYWLSLLGCPTNTSSTVSPKLNYLASQVCSSSRVPPGQQHRHPHQGKPGALGGPTLHLASPNPQLPCSSDTHTSPFQQDQTLTTTPPFAPTLHFPSPLLLTALVPALFEFLRKEEGRMDAKLAITMRTKEQYKHIPVTKSKQVSSQQPHQTEGRSLASSFP